MGFSPRLVVIASFDAAFGKVGNFYQLIPVGICIVLFLQVPQRMSTIRCFLPAVTWTTRRRACLLRHTGGSHYSWQAIAGKKQLAPNTSLYGFNALMFFARLQNTKIGYSLKMKKILLLLVISLVSPQILAESAEISVFSGFRTGGELQDADTGSKVFFDETSSHGFIVGVDSGPEHVMEFLYSFQNTDLYGSSSASVTSTLDMDVEYFQLGGSQIWQQEKIDKFFGATLGVIRLATDDLPVSSKTRFAMSFGGGMVYKITKNIGLRLEARGYFAAMGSSSAFSAGNGECIVVGDGFFRQVDFNAGLRFRF